MSRQIAVLAPATRVMSRKLGPVAGSRSPSSVRARAACATSTLASTCGRWETVASMRSWVSASSAAGRAPRPTAAGAAARRASRAVVGVGVRYQVAPSNSSARAWRTPAFSAPASGCPPMKRSSSTASTTVRLVEPTSVTTQSSPAAASAARTASGSTPTGAATNAASAPSSAASRPAAARSTAPTSSAAVERRRRRVPARHLGAEPLTRGEADRSADQARRRRSRSSPGDHPRS